MKDFRNIKGMDYLENISEEETKVNHSSLLKKGAAVLALCGVFAAGGLLLHQHYVLAKIEAQNTLAAAQAERDLQFMQSVQTAKAAQDANAPATGTAAQAGPVVQDKGVILTAAGTATESVELLNESQVRSIVAQQIGVPESDIIFEKIVLDHDDDHFYGHKHDKHHYSSHRPVYKVECISGWVEYELEIDAVNGTTLKFEVD